MNVEQVATSSCLVPTVDQAKQDVFRWCQFNR